MHQLHTNTWASCRILGSTMDSNVHDSISANDNALTTSTLNMLQSWPHIDLTGLSHAQSHVSHRIDWSRTTFAGPIDDHGPFPSVPFPTHTWNRASQEHTNNQHIRTGTSWASRPGPLTVTIPHDNGSSPYNLGVPALNGFGAYQFTNTAYSGAVSRKPNNYSDPVIWTLSPYETYCPNPTNTSSPMNPETVSSWGEEANTIEKMTGFYPRPLSVQGKQRMCYDHGCNGRKFSSISNLKRHQRERAGRTPLSFCSWCGAAFYRRWTRDHHVIRMSCLRIPR
jgi:hypothetical protein